MAWKTRGLPDIRQGGLCLRQSPGGRSVRPTEAAAHRRAKAWRDPCYVASIVSSRSVNLAAFALIGALVAAASSTLIVQAAQPEACVMTQHDCADTPKIADCCCHADDASHQGGPIESRVQLTVTLSHHPVQLAAGTFADTSVARFHVHTSPASISLPALATRFAPLLV